jgi:hypothetical protein
MPHFLGIRAYLSRQLKKSHCYKLSDNLSKVLQTSSPVKLKNAPPFINSIILRLDWVNPWRRTERVSISHIHVEGILSIIPEISPNFLKTSHPPPELRSFVIFFGSMRYYLFQFDSHRHTST